MGRMVLVFVTAFAVMFWGSMFFLGGPSLPLGTSVSIEQQARLYGGACDDTDCANTGNYCRPGGYPYDCVADQGNGYSTSCQQYGNAWICSDATAYRECMDCSNWGWACEVTQSHPCKGKEKLSGICTGFVFDSWCAGLSEPDEPCGEEATQCRY